MESMYFQPQALLTGDISSTQMLRLDTLIASGQCYGVLHEPTSQHFVEHAVLFLYPWGQDYVRSHRAIRRLALALAAKGIASFRFDYRGTGDSSGDATAFDIATAIEDAQAALIYVLEATGVEQVKVFATRLGALIAFEALSHSDAVTEIHAWDPVLCGETYLTELNSATLEYQGVNWIHGYPMSSAFQQQLSQARIQPGVPTKACFYGAQSEVQAWCRAHQQQGQAVDLSHLNNTDDGSWANSDIVGGFINPHELLKSVEQGLSQEYKV